MIVTRKRSARINSSSNKNEEKIEEKSPESPLAKVLRKYRVRKRKVSTSSDSSSLNEVHGVKNKKRTVIRGKTKVKTSSAKNSKEEANKKPSIKKEKSLPVNHNDPQPSTSKISNDSNSSESDWEDVPQIELEPDLDDYNPIIPENGVDITVETPSVGSTNRKRKKAAFDFAAYARRQLNRFKKDVQIDLHKVHLLCWIAHGLSINKTLNNHLLKALAMSQIPNGFIGQKISKINGLFIDKFIKFFNDFTIESNVDLERNSLKERLIKSFETKRCCSKQDLMFIFIIYVRAIELDVRLCYGLFPITFRANDLIVKKNTIVADLVDCDEPEETDNKNVKKTLKHKTSNSKSNKTDKETKENVKSEAKNSKDENKKKGTAKSRKIKEEKVNTKKSTESSEDDKPPKNKSKKLVSNCEISKTKGIKPKTIKIVSSDSEEETENNCIVKYWSEIYIEADKKWICIDINDQTIKKPYDIDKKMSPKSSYILAIDSLSRIKDLTRKYAPDWLTSVRKKRVDADWWDETINYFAPPSDEKNRDEERLIQALLLEKPIPATVGELKNHPLYVLKRHLLKYEALYPAEAPPMGFMRSEPVYARECVHTLHSRETWMKQAKVVKIGESPYKIVKARPKWNKTSGQMITDLPLEIFGIWQTENYIPPPAKDGKVPRNEYGNIELFQPSMLPEGTVHMQLPGLNRIARKLGIDCASALVGFDGHGGGAHPVFDGWVVCKEFEDTMIAAWEEEQVNIRLREQEKREKRVLGNWRRIVKTLLIREHIQTKYLNNEAGSSNQTE